MIIFYLFHSIVLLSVYWIKINMFYNETILFNIETNELSCVKEV